MTPEAQKILTMIEGVRPDDVQTLDEIDARTWCLTHGKEYEAHKTDKDQMSMRIFVQKDPMTHIANYMTTLFFTRSIDAQEVLRRAGWRIFHLAKDGEYGWECQIIKDTPATLVGSARGISTEPLARLHAWVQVWGMEGT